MDDLTLLWSILGGVLVVGISYGALYTKEQATADRVTALEKEVHKNAEEHNEHVHDVVSRLARIERNVEILVKKADL